MTNGNTYIHFIYQASLCPLIAAFNPFAFKVIIDIYDPIHNKLWKILKEMGIPDHLICLLRHLYTGQEAGQVI